MESARVNVFLNGDLNKKCEATVHGHMTLSELISDCKEKFDINGHTKCKLFDSGGGELSDDDLDYLNPDEPLFLSQGEEFSKNSSILVYEPIKQLGEGGFGSVWLYEHKLNKNLAALKFVSLDSLISAEDVNRVYAEIGVLRGLRHPNIVQLYDAFPLQDKICFVMEFCSGGEMQNYLEEHGKIPEDELYHIGCQMVEAIKYCHDMKIIHRDLKLENVLFANDSKTQIKIVDFGIAGMFAGAHSERSDAGSLLYIAPEVLAKEDNRANPALDIWSIGCIFYYLLTGFHPFEHETQNEIIRKIVNCEYQPLPNTVSRPWHKLIRGILRLNPRRRWNSLRIIEHLYKYRFERDASLSPESEEEQSPAQIESGKKTNRPGKYSKIGAKPVEKKIEIHSPKKKDPRKIIKK
ncbi:unnamed protein product [Blepharisma stoltei]|uniref:Protein kinase domain-containing protein n=1 Tax=Blepharisma stoltei TaxID=1481888 RepID=A0AAU9JTX2_9CILI|nr:unnamed protein product [Blepharisma stoltei]